MLILVLQIETQNEPQVESWWDLIMRLQQRILDPTIKLLIFFFQYDEAGTTVTQLIVW